MRKKLDNPKDCQTSWTLTGQWWGVLYYFELVGYGDEPSFGEVEAQVSDFLAANVPFGQVDFDDVPNQSLEK